MIDVTGLTRWLGPISDISLKRRLPSATAFAAKLDGTSPTDTEFDNHGNRKSA